MIVNNIILRKPLTFIIGIKIQNINRELHGDVSYFTLFFESMKLLWLSRVNFKRKTVYKNSSSGDSET